MNAIPYERPEEDWDKYEDDDYGGNGGVSPFVADRRFREARLLSVRGVGSSSHRISDLC